MKTVIWEPYVRKDTHHYTLHVDANADAMGEYEIKFEGKEYSLAALCDMMHSVIESCENASSFVITVVRVTHTANDNEPNAA